MKIKGVYSKTQKSDVKVSSQRTQKQPFKLHLLFVTPVRFELTIFGMKARRPGPLDDGARLEYFTIQEGYIQIDLEENLKKLKIFLSSP